MLRNFSKNNYALPFLLSAAVICYVYRGILIHPTTHLLDKFDYPYYSWLLNHILQFITGSHNSLFTTNIFFPFENSYFFSDLFIPQAILGLIPYLLGFNPIAVTNFVLIGSSLLNILAAIHLWRKKFTNQWILSFLTLITAVSPSIFLQSGHLQMLTLWPFLLTISLLIDTQKNLKKAVFIGILWTIQLLASVYLGIFLLFCISWAFVLDIWLKPSKKNILQFYLLVAVVSSSLGGPVLAQYKLVQNSYEVTINYGDYVSYNAHLSDYLFIPYQTIGSRLSASWQQLNQHTYSEKSMYPGTAVVLLTLVGLFGFKKIKSKLHWSLSLSFNHLFFLGLMCLGFIFSLGPRLFINGAYVQFPAPYILPLKLLPFLAAIRATARWSWLVYLSLPFFCGIALNKLNSKKLIAFVSMLATFLYIVELVPLSNKSIDVSPGLTDTQGITTSCTQDTSLIIYPITSENEEADMFSILSRKTEDLLQSTQFSCKVVNGYGGFEPPQYKMLEADLEHLLDAQDFTSFLELLKQKEINMLLLESNYLSIEDKKYVDSFILENQKNNTHFTIIESQPNQWYLFKL